MIRNPKWYGYTARTPEEYFVNNCHTYSDIVDVLNRKDDINLIRDLTPSIESFISDSGQTVTNEFIETLMRRGDEYSMDLIMESVGYVNSHINEVDNEEKDKWFIWLDIPEIERSYRMGKVNESAKEILNTSLYSFADKIVGNFSNLDSIKVNSAIESFKDNVDYKTMINWDKNRNDISKKSEMAVYVGDMINDAKTYDLSSIVKESIMSDINLSLQDISKSIYNNDEETGYTLENYRNIIDDVWGYFANLESYGDLANEIKSYYDMHMMTIPVSQYLTAIESMNAMGCFPEYMEESMREAISYASDNWYSIPGDSAKSFNGLLESMIAMETPEIEYGTIVLTSDLKDFLDSTNYVAESDHEEDAPKHRTKDTLREIHKSTHKLYKKYKDNERAVDQKLTKLCKRATYIVSDGSPEEVRSYLVDGEYSVMTIIKKIIGGYAIFAYSKLAFLCALITRALNKGKIRNSEKNKLIYELEAEIAIVDEKIKDASSDGDREAKYALMRSKSSLENTLKRLKKGEEAMPGR